MKQVTGGLASDRSSQPDSRLQERLCSVLYGIELQYSILTLKPTLAIYRKKGGIERVIKPVEIEYIASCFSQTFKGTRGG